MKLSRPQLDALKILVANNGYAGTTVSNKSPSYVGGITATALERLGLVAVRYDLNRHLTWVEITQAGREAFRASGACSEDRVAKRLEAGDMQRIEMLLDAIAPGLPWASRPASRDGEEVLDIIHHGRHRGNVNTNVCESIPLEYEDEATLIENAPRWLRALLDEVREHRGQR